MGRVSKRKKQRQTLMDEARSLKLDRITKSKTTTSSSTEKTIRSTRIIAAASNIRTKASSNRFSKLMKLYKDNKKLKKSIQCEKLRRAREAKKIKSQLKEVHQETENLGQHDPLEDEIMDIEQPQAYVTTEFPSSSKTNHPATKNNHAQEEPQIIKFVPKKNVKMIQKRSMFHRIRKLRKIAEEMTGGAAYVNSPNQRCRLPINKQAELLFVKKLRARQIDHLSALTGKCFTYKTLMKKLKPVLEKFPIVRTEDDKLTVSIIASLKERLKYVVNKLPKNRRIRITIVADKGEKITKICYYFNDVQKPQATENLGILCFYVGDDDSTSIKTICETLNKEIEKLLEDGLLINKIRYDFEFFITGDCKSICSMLGVQGCNAKKFCHHCLTDDYCIQDSCRTIEGIMKDAKAVVDEIEKLRRSKKKVTDNKIRLIKQMFNSISHEPYFKKIDHKHIVPPALHLLMALANKLILYFKHTRLDKIIQGLKVEPIQGRTEYNGNSCRKIINYFRENKAESINELQMFHLFKQVSKIQSFAVARSLTKTEIDECSDAIQRLFDDLDGLSKFKYNNKLHILRFHVIQFIRLYYSWGLFSEQSIERLHCLVNEYRKRISTKNEMEKNIYAMKMLVLGTFFYDIQ